MNLTLSVKVYMGVQRIGGLWSPLIRALSSTRSRKPNPCLLKWRLLFRTSLKLVLIELNKFFKALIISNSVLILYFHIMIGFASPVLVIS